MHVDRGAEVWHHLGCPQHVDHHDAAAWPELDQAELSRRPRRPPGRGRPQTDKLAEHLTDLGSRRKVARRAERVARRVVTPFGMGETKLHVLRHAHRAADRNTPANIRFERGNLHHVRRTAPLRKAAAMSAMPASINGTDSSVPMVKPPHRNPSWGSGSRNCSQTDRASA